jgi:hypothetical protein
MWAWSRSRGKTCEQSGQIPSGNEIIGTSAKPL